VLPELAIEESEDREDELFRRFGGIDVMVDVEDVE
jgi:hypothetical protein